MDKIECWSTFIWFNNEKRVTFLDEKRCWERERKGWEGVGKEGDDDDDDERVKKKTFHFLLTGNCTFCSVSMRAENFVFSHVCLQLMIMLQTNNNYHHVDVNWW